LSGIQRQPEDLRVGLADVDETGGNEGVDELGQLERSNAMCIELARFVADPGFEPSDQLDHLRIGV
jgi:hypothetical protein